MELLDLFSRSQTVFQSIVDAVRPDQLGNDTQDDRDVRSLINHVVGGNYAFAARLTGQPVPDRSADFLGDDPVEAVRRSAETLRVAFNQPGVFDTQIPFPGGDRSGLTLLRMRFNENLAHGWDIARATGQETDRDRDLYEAAIAQAPGLFGGPRQPGGAYAPEQPAPAGASPADRLAAYLGKKV